MYLQTLSQRQQIAETLRKIVLPAEAAERKAKEATTSELIHRIGSEMLSPPVTQIEMNAYIAEARERLRKW